MSTQVIQEVKLNLGGCLPIGSEITDVQVDCEQNQLIIVQIDERGNETTFIADLCSDQDTFMTVVDNGDGTITATNVGGEQVTWDRDTDISDFTFDPTTGDLSITEDSTTLTVNLNLCEWMSNQQDNGNYIGG